MNLQRDIRRKNLGQIANNCGEAMKYLGRKLTENELKIVYTFSANEKFVPAKLFGCEEESKEQAQATYIYRRRR